MLPDDLLVAVASSRCVWSTVSMIAQHSVGIARMEMQETSVHMGTSRLGHAKSTELSDSTHATRH